MKLEIENKKLEIRDIGVRTNEVRSPSRAFIELGTTAF